MTFRIQDNLAADKTAFCFNALKNDVEKVTFDTSAFQQREGIRALQLCMIMHAGPGLQQGMHIPDPCASGG